MPVAQVRADTLYAWKGPSLLVTTPRGECGETQPLSGFYYREARVLRTLRIEINGAAPWLAEATMAAPDRLEFTYVHPEITHPGGGGTGQAGDEEGVDAHGLPERSLDLRTTCLAGVIGLDVVVVITNRARRQVSFALRCVLDADFADIQEAAFGRQQSSPVRASTSDAAVTFEYDNHQLPYRCRVGGEGWNAGVQNGVASLDAAVVLEPQQARRFTLRVKTWFRDVALPDADAQARGDALHAWRSRFTRVSIPGDRALERVLARNVRDIGSFPALEGAPDEWLALQA